MAKCGSCKKPLGLDWKNHRCGKPDFRRAHTASIRTPDPDGGLSYASNYEARVGSELRLAARAESKPGTNGILVVIARQAAIPIEGQSTGQRVDFVRIEIPMGPDGLPFYEEDGKYYSRVSFIDAKGRDLPAHKHVRKQVNDRWGIDIELRKQGRK